MTTRTLVMLEPAVRERVRGMARAEGVSVSSKCRDLIREALELEEDAHWARAAEAREHKPPRRWLSHRETWGR